MVVIRATIDGKAHTISDAPSDMRTATDEQVLGYVRETLAVQLEGDYQVERTAEGLLIHAAPVYG